MNTRIEQMQLDFLKKNGSSTIKHLLLLHLNDTESKEFKRNYNELLQLPIISYWKNNIPTDLVNTNILGSSDSCFENSFGKLLSFGLSVNNIVPRPVLIKYVSFLATNKSHDIYESLARYVVAGYLYAADYSHEIVSEIINNRINLLYNFVTTSPIKYTIYSDISSFRIPSQYKSKKIVNPILYEKNELVLPLIHDIFIFSHIYNKISIEYKNKINAIVDYIAHDKYQSLDYGYGIIKSSQNKCHLMGWSAHLPLFNKNLSSDYFKKGLIYRMALFSNFGNQKTQLWIKETLIKLEEFKLDDFRYCFSNDLLPETKNSYFMNGRHTSLNENRRQKTGRTVESTYYVYLSSQNIDCTPNIEKETNEKGS